MSESQADPDASDDCLLFTYGLLMPHLRPPKTMSEHWPDAIRGELFHLGPYPGALRVSAWSNQPGDDVIEGSVLRISPAELPALDEFEDTKTGLYVRMSTTARSGNRVWVYQYNRALPAGARRISRWEG